VEEAFNKTRAEVEEFFAACIHDIFTNVPAREGAAQTLRSLADRGCSIHLITHRDERHRQVTEDWLRRHGFVYDSLTMCSTGTGYSKKEACLELGVQFFVDDKLENAQEVAASGIYTLLFFASHNAQRPNDLPLVKNWTEVSEHIEFFLNQRQRQAR